MARVTEVTVAGASASNAIPLNHYVTPFNVGFSVNVVGSAAPTYSVQHTFHDVLADSSAVWFDHALVSGKTADQDGSYVAPVMAVRLNLTAAGSASSATLRVVQAGA